MNTTTNKQPRTPRSLVKPAPAAPPEETPAPRIIPATLEGNRIRARVDGRRWIYSFGDAPASRTPIVMRIDFSATKTAEVYSLITVERGDDRQMGYQFLGHAHRYGVEQLTAPGAPATVTG